MPGGGAPPRGFRWVAGTAVPPLTGLRVSAAFGLLPISGAIRVLARSVSSEGEPLCSTPSESHLSARAVAPLLPVTTAAAFTLVPLCRAFLPHPGCTHRASAQGRDRPLDVAASPEPSCLPQRLQLRPADRALQAGTLAAGVRLPAPREATGVARAAA